MSNNDSELSALIQSMQKQEVNPQKEANQEEEKKPVVEEQKMTPLEELQREREKTGSGMVVSNEDLEKGKATSPMKNIVFNDERVNNINARVDEMDETLRKRKSVIVTQKPMTEAQYIQLMVEIDSVNYDEQGNPYFDYKDDDGNKIIPKMCRLRREDEPEDTLQIQNEFKEEGSTNANDDVEDGSEADSSITPEKQALVEVLIDKTGFGADFNFTEEEKSKIAMASTIKINEVRKLDISSIRSKRSTKSFQETIVPFSTEGSRTMMQFPASGFKAQMKGLSYGEYADIALSMETVTFDQYYKRLSIIYNKMTNISSGPFESFEDFLHRFAYTDIPMAVYGMFIATEAENQTIPLRCGKKECNKSFNWDYHTRSILRLEKCGDVFLEKMKELASMNAVDYDAIKARSAVEVSNTIELPYSKIVVEMGIASAYDFLYNFIPVLNEETFKENFGEDENDIYKNNVLLLTCIRSVWVPQEDGTYVECVGFKDILDAIYQIRPEEIRILAAYTAKYQQDYTITFSFGSVKCPHCGNITKDLEISIDDLVFQTYQRLMNTDIDLSTLQSL